MKKLLVFLFFVSTAYSAQLPPEAKFEEINDFSGGLNTAFNPQKLESRFATKINDFYIDEKPGSLVRRNGYTVSAVTNTLNSGIMFLFPFNKETGEKLFIVSDGSSVLATSDLTSFTLIRGGLKGTPISATQLRNKAWLTNGYDNAFTWDGSSVVVLNGQNGTPNVPKCKYIISHQERIWLLNDLNNRSALYFSALTSTDGYSIAPDNALAWPSDNQLNIGQGDGTDGSGLFTFKSQLFVSKNRSIYAIFGTDEESYYARKTNSGVGLTSNDSVSLLDNLVYFLGIDGIYAFDGNDAVRISDLISPDIDGFNKNETAGTFTVWDKTSDFNKGKFEGSSITYNSNDSVSIHERLTQAGVLNIREIASSTDSTYDLSVGVSTEGVVIPSVFPENSYNGYVYYVGVRPIILDGSNPSVCVKVHKNGTEVSSGTIQASQNGIFFGDTAGFSPAELRNGSLSIKLIGVNGGESRITTPWAGCQVSLLPLTTGSFTSEISTFTDVGVWGQFGVESTLNGGNISYFVRHSTAINIIENKPFNPISSGGVLNFTTGTGYAQWASTISSVNKSVDVTRLEKVTMETIVGGLSPNARPISAVWKNRYWLCVTTEVTRNFSAVYVKAKQTNQNPNAWMRLSNHKIRSFGEFAGNFYAGSSTAGVILSLDDGYNDAGVAIDAFYETPNLLMGDNYYDKKLIEYDVDLEKNTNGSLFIGTSKNGNDFTVSTVTYSGSGRLLRRINTVNDYGKYFKFRIRENSFDLPFTFNGLTVVYLPTKNRD